MDAEVQAGDRLKLKPIAVVIDFTLLPVDLSDHLRELFLVEIDPSRSDGVDNLAICAKFNAATLADDHCIVGRIVCGADGSTTVVAVGGESV